MSTNLIDLFLNSVGGSFVNQTSGKLGESTQNISASLGSVAASLLGSMILKGNTDSGALGLMDFISGNGLSDVLFRETGSSGDGIDNEELMAKGSTTLQYLVGNNLPSLVDMISGGAGLKTSSASSMLRSVAPLLMGYLGKLVKEQSLNPSGIKDLLLSQAGYVQKNTSADISNLLGFSGFSDSMNTASSLSGSGGTNSSAGSSGMSKFLPWLILGLTSLGLFYFLQKGCHGPAGSSATPAADTTHTTLQHSDVRSEAPSSGGIVSMPSGGATAPAVPGTEKLKTYELPNGTKLNAEPNTFTAILVTYLNSKEKTGKCIPFDDVSFQPGTDQLTQKSEPQLSHLDLILMAYPDMKIDIYGYYADNTSDTQHNLEMSKSRAAAVKIWLIRNGIDEKRMQFYGKGESSPIASNNTMAGLEKNRRVEICVSK